MAEENFTITEKLYLRIRFATEADVHHIHKLFYQIHAFHKETHLYKATESSLADFLFNKEDPKPLFYGPTILLLEVSPTPFPQINTDDNFMPVLKTIDLKGPVVDREAEEFRSKYGDGKGDVLVAGYSFFFANYSSLYDKPGIYSENLYFRESYRKLGLGKLLFSTLATIAEKNGFTSVEGIVAVWNKKSYDFYIDMGVQMYDDFRYGKLVGDALKKLAHRAKL